MTISKSFELKETLTIIFRNYLFVILTLKTVSIISLGPILSAANVKYAIPVKMTKRKEPKAHVKASLTCDLCRKC